MYKTHRWLPFAWTVIRDVYLRPITVIVLVVNSDDCLEHSLSYALRSKDYKSLVLLIKLRMHKI